jgi:hypothetical protein
MTNIIETYNLSDFFDDNKTIDQASEKPKTISSALKSLSDNANLNGSPIRPALAKRKWEKADSAPSSPDKGNFRVSVMPPTPKKKQAKASTKPLSTPSSVSASFGDELPVADSSQDTIQGLRRITGLPMIGHLYQLPSNKVVAAIQQPLQERPTCGPGCVLMIASERMDKLSLNKNFWNWYGGTRLANASSLLNGFRLLEIPAKICRLTTKLSPFQDPTIEHKLVTPAEAIARIKETIDATKKPVILAITHPHLKGHWIIVDGFDKGFAWVRDPYTGKAFSLPEATLSKWLLEDEPLQEMIYFPEPF